MSFGRDLSKPQPTRQYINGVPLLLDLNEILNLDVIAMAMKEQESRKSRHKRRKVLPEKDEQQDPSIYVEERLTFFTDGGDEEEEEEKVKLEEETKGEKMPLGPQFYIDIESQVMSKLRKDFTEPEDDDSCSNGSESDESDNAGDEEQAHRLAMEMMLSGEHPDAEIDKLLESFGVQISQIGLIPTSNFFKGEIPEQNERLGEEIREQIDEKRFIYKNWSTDKLTDK